MAKRKQNPKRRFHYETRGIFLTDASVIDTDIRISCDTTGLSEKAVKILSGMEKSDVEKLSKLIEFYNTIR